MSSFNKNFSKISKSFKFWDFNFSLPKITKDFIVTLGEGGTPCKNSEKIGKNLGLNNLSFKDETQNPTSSFKDRVGALLISHARNWDYNKVVCASNGNQGASIAAYASLEGMKCVNIIPNQIDIGKKAQMIAYNSELETKGDTIDDAIEYALDKSFNEYYQCTPEYNPLTIEAQKTLAFEIFIQKGIPDYIVIPMGSGELLVSLWKGFNELEKSGTTNKFPKLIGVQSKSSAPIVNEFIGKPRDELKNLEIPKSIALGIFVKKPAFKDLAIKFIKESGGTVVAIEEELIVNSIDNLIRNEGIFAEPASTLTLGAVEVLNKKNSFHPNESIICLITGSGLKAPYILEAISSQAKTAGKGSIIITKLKILSQISLSSIKGITGTEIKEVMTSISLASIYQHLQGLELKGLIYRKKEGKKVLYFITETGKKVLDALDILITLL
ncbi:MAG: pyridoxal-phosphate dependent enzyme [Candidatus Odinarchaeota archaeon]